jgi:hypothetical protein
MSEARAPQPRKASFWRSVRTVAWGFLGIRKKSGYQDDLAQVNPFHVVLAALAGVVILVLALVGIARWVVASA